MIKILGTNKKYLCQAISENSDENFRSFIFHYRVDEAKRIMKNGIRSNEQINLSEVYTSAGFNSTASFCRAIKLLTGLTPKEYAMETRKGTRKPII
ncbi:MAG: helix-turn-helix domain-containing protein [Ferruginibacter sp.]